MNRKALLFLSIFLLIVFVRAALAADDHVVEERSRTYMGRTIPPRQAEIWIGEASYCYKSRTFIHITRYDLKKKYTINLGNKKYMEEPLEEPSTPAPPEKKVVRIQELGFERITPVYDWIVKKTDEEKVIEGKKCRLIILDGDADYAEEKRELWLTRDVPIDIARYFERIVKPGLDEEWRKVYEAHPELRDSFILESITTTEGPIAPTIVWEQRVKTIEAADPPEGIYAVPEGFTRVETRDELYAR